jgi:Transglycosylase SLT domain
MAPQSFVSSILRSSAPTLLTALAIQPPFNLIPSPVVSGVLNKYLPEGQKPPKADPNAPATPPPPLTPDQIQEIVERNGQSAQFLADLRQTEADLKRYEIQAGSRFAEIAEQDRGRAGDFQAKTDIARPVLYAGRGLVGLAVLSMIVVVVGSLYVAFYGAPTPASGNTNVLTATFGLIGTVVGFVNGVADTIVHFYYSSSQGSKDESDTLADNLTRLSQDLGGAAARTPVTLPAPAQTPLPASGSDQHFAEETSAALFKPATPAAPDAGAQEIVRLKAPRKQFDEGVSWQLTKDGISIDGAPVMGSMGPPTTVTNIWTRFADRYKSAAKEYGVPIELVIAAIATESSGDPSARRPEPKLGTESVGLMQTLVTAAPQVLGTTNLTGDKLLDPTTSIRAGTAYIAQQRVSTHFDPPPAAAAYNAGSLRRQDADANRWKLVCFPQNTGVHVDRFVQWFNDAMQVSETQGWAREPDVPQGCSTLRSSLT